MLNKLNNTNAIVNVEIFIFLRFEVEKFIPRVSGIKNFKRGHSQNWKLYRHQTCAQGTVDHIKIARILTMEIRGIGIIQVDPRA